MPDILCLGEPLVEFNHVGGNEWRQGFGGDVSNVAVATARQGVPSGILTRIGADGFGETLEQLWEAEGIDTSHVIRDEEAPTGLYFVTHDASGHAFEYRRKGSAASRISPGDLPRDLGGTQILHLSGISQAISDSARKTASHAIDLARSLGVWVSYDPNLRLALWPIEVARASILEALARCDIALPGLDDARILLGLDDPDGIVAALRKMGPDLVALTMGQDGVLLGTHDGTDHIPSPKVDAVDATGAGDCFDGAFLARILKGDTPLDAARYAAQAAAISTTSFGAVDSIPDSTEVREALARPSET